jgi:hypothetical protein
LSPREWIQSNGGPLLLLPQDLLETWEGADPPSGGRRVEAEFRFDPTGPATDYDRACDIGEFVGAIEIGEGFGLVLGDEPLATTWISLGPTAGVLARWRFGPSHEAVERSLISVADLAGWQESLVFHLTSRPSVLLDAAEPGSERMGRRLVIDLTPGQYVVETLEFRPEAEIALLLHRLRA